jgi:polar amino acid transport system substrate-binding protein
VIQRSRVVVLASVICTVGALTLSSCASNKDNTNSGSKTTSGGSGTSATGPSLDAAAAALVPAALKTKGTMQVGVDATYAPNEYKDSSDKIVGFDIDLFNAVATTIGLKANFVASNFDNIIPGITGGKYDVGVSSFTDNKKREATVDFVTYYSAGIQFVSTDKTFDPANACGKKVAVQAATIELDDLNVRSKACTSAGKASINIQQFTAQGDATTAVTLGKVVAMSADYPVSVDAVDKSGGKLQLVGPSNFSAAPYGYAVAKGSPLEKALQAAVQKLIDSGAYDTICKKWNLTAGEIKTAQINAAVS